MKSTQRTADKDCYNYSREKEGNYFRRNENLPQNYNVLELLVSHKNVTL